MKLLKALGKRLLFPPLLAVLPLALLSTGLLAYVFAAGQEDTPLAYAAYALSAYALVLVCAAVPRMLRLGGQVRQNALVDHLVSDYAFRTHFMLRVGLLLNLAFAMFKLCTGIVYSSYWLIVLGIYYALLALIRFLLLRRQGETGAGTAELAAQYRAYRLTGVLLLALGVVMSAIILQVVRDNRTYSYPGTIIYAFGAYAFTRIIMAAVNLIRRRGRDNPLFAAARCLSLATAIVSVFSLQTALLSTFGTEEPAFRLIANAASGAAVCASILLMAVLMVRRSTRGLRSLQKQLKQEVCHEQHTNP